MQSYGNKDHLCKTMATVKWLGQRRWREKAHAVFLSYDRFKLSSVVSIKKTKKQK